MNITECNVKKQTNYSLSMNGIIISAWYQCLLLCGLQQYRLDSFSTTTWLFLSLNLSWNNTPLFAGKVINCVYCCQSSIDQDSCAVHVTCRSNLHKHFISHYHKSYWCNYSLTWNTKYVYTQNYWLLIVMWESVKLDNSWLQNWQWTSSRYIQPCGSWHCDEIGLLEKVCENYQLNRVLPDTKYCTPYRNIWERMKIICTAKHLYLFKSLNRLKPIQFQPWWNEHKFYSPCPIFFTTNPIQVSFILSLLIHYFYMLSIQHEWSPLGSTLSCLRTNKSRTHNCKGPGKSLSLNSFNV